MTTIIWKGIIYDSLEYFQLLRKNDTIYVTSKIIGTYEDKFYIVEYSISISKNWSLISFDVELEVNNDKKKITGEKNNGQWLINGECTPLFTNFDFIDISLTPFTNTLPINHLHLTDNCEKEINVIYIDILRGELEPVKQIYRKISDLSYHYENVPNDFEAEIVTDEDGFVAFYPNLFKRIIKQENNG